MRDHRLKEAANAPSNPSEYFTTDLEAHVTPLNPVFILDPKKKQRPVPQEP